MSWGRSQVPRGTGALSGLQASLRGPLTRQSLQTASSGYSVTQGKLGQSGTIVCSRNLLQWCVQLNFKPITLFKFSNLLNVVFSNKWMVAWFESFLSPADWMIFIFVPVKFHRTFLRCHTGLRCAHSRHFGWRPTLDCKIKIFLYYQNLKIRAY